jgi:hypothetical protein
MEFAKGLGQINRVQMIFPSVVFTVTNWISFVYNVRRNQITYSDLKACFPRTGHKNGE